MKSGMGVEQIEDLLRRAAERYYNAPEDGLILTDEEFDELKAEWEDRTGNKWEVGAAPNVTSTVTMTHGYESLAGTLDKVNSIEELEEWLRLKNYEVSEETPLFASIKYDGHSVATEYEKNKLVKALTRGKDGVGKDLTGYFQKAFDGCLRSAKPMVGGKAVPDFGITYEADIKWEDLKKLNEEFGTDYRSPRSAISGIIKEDGLPLSKYLTLIPLKIRVKGKEHDLDRHDETEALSALDASCYSQMEILPVTSIDEMREVYAAIGEGRGDLDFMIDGLVVEIPDSKLRKKLGYASNRPNFAVALKFPYVQKRTTIRDVEWYTEGNGGTYTPVAVFDPVVINGHTYTKTSLANLRRFRELALHEGDQLIFSLRNDVLGYVEKADSPKNGKGIKFDRPKKCSCCGGPLAVGIFLRCENDECDLNMIGNIQQFVEKVGIKGIKRNTIQDLFDAKIVTRPEELLGLDGRKIAKLPGYGVQAAKKITDAIEKRLFKEKIYDYELLGSLNINLVSRDRAKLILQHTTIQHLAGRYGDVELNVLKDIHGIGEEIVEALTEGIEVKERTLNALLEGLTLKVYSDEVKAAKAQVGGDGKAYAICVTGALRHYGREEFKHEIEKLGHRMVSGVTKKTDYLVTNDTTSGTEKNAKARSLGIPVIDENEAIELLGLSRRGAKKVDIEEEL